MSESSRASSPSQSLSISAAAASNNVQYLTNQPTNKPISQSSNKPTNQLSSKSNSQQQNKPMNPPQKSSLKSPKHAHSQWSESDSSVSYYNVKRESGKKTPAFRALWSRDVHPVTTAMEREGTSVSKTKWQVSPV